jgi:hypothetical protein
MRIMTNDNKGITKIPLLDAIVYGTLVAFMTFLFCLVWQSDVMSSLVIAAFFYGGFGYYKGRTEN